MRIFFVTNNYTPYAGGVINSITATTDALRAQGHEVFIITLNFLGTQHNDPDYVIRVPCPIKFLYRTNHMAIPWRPTHAILQLLEQYAPDIVHVHHPFLLGVSALRAARKRNIPCVFTYHTIYEQHAHYVPIAGLYSKPFIRSAVRHFCNKVDGIIVPSNAVKKYVEQQQISSPITIIPSPLRPYFLAAKLDTTPLHNKKYFELLLVSRFVPEKNIPFVFEIFKQLPENITLTLVGYGIDYEAMQTLAFDTLQLSKKRIRFIHKPTQDELLKLYRNADLFIFTSTIDTQGLVLAEGMSQGLPVIALDGPGQRDIVRNGINGFIITNADHAAKTIITIAHNKYLHKKLVNGARTTAQNYHSKAIIHQLLTFYNSTYS
jgi:1,2-diacylglycerol 3-alpha-glucosyltransferase